MRGVLYVIFLLSLVILTGCAEKKLAATSRGIPGYRYDSKFPSENKSVELELVTRSVKKIYSVSTYITYQFKREAGITFYHILKGTYKNAAWGIITTNETVFGTGTVIGVSGSGIALLTCAHVVNSPDTLFSFYDGTEEDPLRYIRSFSIKEKQENWVKELSSCGPFTVLASDNASDIAFLGKKCEDFADTIAPAPCSMGQAKNLGWGSFVYILGYPMGSLMITQGIASPAAKRPMGEFTVDALLNKGCSGGVIMAIREGSPGFELVGMVKNVNSTREEFLKPAPGEQSRADWLPYTGEIHTGNSEIIQYGMNAVVTMESIRDFYEKNREEMTIRGYNLDSFLTAETQRR